MLVLCFGGIDSLCCFDDFGCGAVVWVWYRAALFAVLGSLGSFTEWGFLEFWRVWWLVLFLFS